MRDIAAEAKTAPGPASPRSGPGSRSPAENAERYQELAAAADGHCPVLDLFRNITLVTRALT
jgi:hypothetical protein